MTDEESETLEAGAPVTDTSDAERDRDRDDVDVDAVDRTGPLSDLAAAVDDRRAGPDDGPATDDGPEGDDLFDRESVDDIDRDRLWERLEEGDDAEAVIETTSREIREVDKGSYCHQCDHFAAPPTVGCTREGTEILELTSFERFRVADCPVVLEDEALEGRE